jgi:hypothetical protein
MAKKIRMIVVMEYEPERDWYNDASWEGVSIEWGDIETIAKYDAKCLMDEELIAPQDWNKDVVQVVSAFVVDSETHMETMVTSLAKDVNNG